ncbi:hypothetical protein SAMN04488168_101429 [Bacillus sp. 491mf]|uniref:hypothetical protein n=1 Tax=Bacillus TaxID=1386 RepID=UPI00054F1726|nr:MULTISPECIES: hypothetical protein [unclassified Bacillus (in: firmicutes)]SFC00457.1 hypothetical protein SAMN04488168_101429 [Bacillus sp. 491mf]
MKAKRLVTLAIPTMLLLGGCATDKAETKAKDSKVVEEKKDYKMEMAYLMKDLSEQSMAIQGILTSETSIDEKAVEFKEKSAPLVKTANKLQKLEPGEKYKDVHATLNESMKLVKDSVVKTQEGLDKKDRNLITEGLQLMSNGSKLITEAHNKLKEMGEAN